MPSDVVVAKDATDSGDVKASPRKTKKSAGKQGQVPLRFVTAASLFDGHDASINIMRRILQSQGAEVIHLGHNRSVDDVVTAAVQEDAHAIAVSSYQGGHVEYFKYMLDLLRERGAGHIRVFGGGGGVIVREEIDDLHAYGVTRIYSPEDGQKLGLKGMISDMAEVRPSRILCDDCAGQHEGSCGSGASHSGPLHFGNRVRYYRLNASSQREIRAGGGEGGRLVPVLGITGTGGAGKSSLTDELVRRFRQHSGEPRIAVIAIDPTKRKTGGALLGDRIRMNAIGAPNIYFRSLSTRGAIGEVPESLSDIIAACKAAGFDLVIVETPGIGQGDAGIVPYSDVSLYVMTPEFGAQSQLEKIDMLDFADAIAINKFDRRGAADALRDVSKQYQRNHERFLRILRTDMPVFGTIASRFADPGVTALYQKLICEFWLIRGLATGPVIWNRCSIRSSEPGTAIVPPSRQWYLAESRRAVRGYHRIIDEQVHHRPRAPAACAKRSEMLAETGDDTRARSSAKMERREKKDSIPAPSRLLETWPTVRRGLFQGRRICLFTEAGHGSSV